MADSDHRRGFLIPLLSPSLSNKHKHRYKFGLAPISRLNSPNSVIKVFLKRKKELMIEEWRWYLGRAQGKDGPKNLARKKVLNLIL